MKSIYKLIIKVLSGILIIHLNIWALSGTGGTPLGGMGTGYVKFDGSKFSVSGKLPPAAADHCKGQAEKKISSSGFHLFADGVAKSPAEAILEDAKCPLQTADFGTTCDLAFTLNAFGPYWPGEGVEKYQLATSPLALFDITVKNKGASSAEAAVAMEFANGGLLGGAENGTLDGKQGISFEGSPDNAYLMVECSGASPTFSAGVYGSFSSNGTLSNTGGNLVAAKCTIDPGKKVHFKFVLAWYRTYDEEGYYYHNFYKNSKEAALFGMSKFDNVRDGITSFVDRLMASNFPDWYKDRLLNNTYPLIHNSVCAKDGRTAFWEGNYGIIGTIDQGQHAAVFYTFNWPSVQWHELQYWIRQQKPSGQIHHDFNRGVYRFTSGSSGNNRHLLPWDDKNHADYWWFPNTDSWADLNCMFIFKAYELMLATGDLDSMKKSWPGIKKAANRLLSQCRSGSKLPLKSHSTYDRCTGPGTNCTLTPEYNGGLAITAYHAVSEMAKFVGDDAYASAFYDNFNTAKEEYKELYGNSSDYGVKASVPNSGHFPESHIAGYSWADYFCLGPSMDDNFITKTCEKMRLKQKSGDVRANGEWIFYSVDHYGGSEIAINRPDDALFIHRLDYYYYYKQVPNQVHWQSLQKGDGNTGHDSYMTAPVVWHSYFQFCGYMIDNAFKRLWIRPRIPTEMNGKITNALLLNPKCHGTLNYEENINDSCTQQMTVSYDDPGVKVREIVLKNNTGVNTPFVYINGDGSHKVTTSGAGLSKNISVTLKKPVLIKQDGLKIEVYNKKCLGFDISSVKGNTNINPFPLEIRSFFLTAGSKPIHYSVSLGGMISIELLRINGSRIGTIFKKKVTKGHHKFVWNGKTLKGSTVGSGFAVLRLVTPDGSVVKPVVINL